MDVTIAQYYVFNVEKYFHAYARLELLPVSRQSVRRLPLFSARPVVIFLVAEHAAMPNYTALPETHRCEQFAQSHYMEVELLCNPNNYTTTPH